MRSLQLRLQHPPLSSSASPRPTRPTLSIDRHVCSSQPLFARQAPCLSIFIRSRVEIIGVSAMISSAVLAANLVFRGGRIQSFVVQPNTKQEKRGKKCTYLIGGGYFLCKDSIRRKQRRIFEKTGLLTLSLSGFIKSRIILSSLINFQCD